MGHVVSTQEVSIDQERVKAEMSLERPNVNLRDT